MGSDFTKWEKSSIKVNVLLPIVFVAVAFVLIIALVVFKPKPPQIQKKDAAATAEIEQAAGVDGIDWENF